MTRRNLGHVYGWLESPYGPGHTPDLLPITSIDPMTGVITVLAFVGGGRGTMKGLPQEFEAHGFHFLKHRRKENV